MREPRRTARTGCTRREAARTRGVEGGACEPCGSPAPGGRVRPGPRRAPRAARTTTKEIANGNSVYVANRDFAAKYPKALAAVIEEVTKITEWAAQNRDKFAEATSAAIGIELDVERTAIGRTDMVVGPVTPTIVAQLQETADAFLKLGLIPKPIVIHDAVWSAPAD